MRDWYRQPGHGHFLEANWESIAVLYDPVVPPAGQLWGGSLNLFSYLASTTFQVLFEGGTENTVVNKRYKHIYLYGA